MKLLREPSHQKTKKNPRKISKFKNQNNPRTLQSIVQQECVGAHVSPAGLSVDRRRVISSESSGDSVVPGRGHSLQ